LERFHKFKQDRSKNEAEFGIIPFRTALKQKAKELKSNQPIQSGILVVENNDIIDYIPSENEKTKKELLSDDYRDFDNKNKDIYEEESKNGKLRSEEQGKNISSDNKEVLTHRTLDQREMKKRPERSKRFGSQKDFPKPSLILVGDLNESKDKHPIEDSMIQTQDLREDQVRLENDTSNGSKLLIKYEEKTTPDTLDDKILLNKDEIKSNKGFKQSIRLNLGSSYAKGEGTFFEGDTIDFAEGQILGEWKQTPLYLISLRCKNEHNVINALLDIKNIDVQKLGIEKFTELEIIEFENEVNIILTALKRKMKIETLIINSVSNSKDTNGSGGIMSRNEEKNSMYTFLHTSRYVIVLENTLRYLIHLVGLSNYLGSNRQSDKAFKDKIDFLESEIKL
jgi:hypothetical protein